MRFAACCTTGISSKSLCGASSHVFILVYCYYLLVVKDRAELSPLKKRKLYLIMNVTCSFNKNCKYKLYFIL